MHVSTYHVINDQQTDVMKVSIFSNDIDDIPEDGEYVRTDLDYRANMAVLGK